MPQEQRVCVAKPPTSRAGFDRVPGNSIYVAETDDATVKGPGRSVKKIPDGICSCVAAP